MHGESNKIEFPTKSVNLTGFDPLETRGVVVLVVDRSGQCRPDGTVLFSNHKLGSNGSTMDERERKVLLKERKGILAIEVPLRINPS